MLCIRQGRLKSAEKWLHTSSILQDFSGGGEKCKQLITIDLMFIFQNMSISIPPTWERVRFMAAKSFDTLSGLLSKSLSSKTSSHLLNRSYVLLMPSKSTKKRRKCTKTTGYKIINLIKPLKRCLNTVEKTVDFEGGGNTNTKNILIFDLSV